VEGNHGGSGLSLRGFYANKKEGGTKSPLNREGLAATKGPSSLAQCATRIVDGYARHPRLAGRPWRLSVTEKICKELDISPTNCWVLLHRARVFTTSCRRYWNAASTFHRWLTSRAKPSASHTQAQHQRHEHARHAS
jgi:hypothetical protein